MADTFIKYRTGLKYQLAEDYTIETSIKPPADIETRFIALNTQGQLNVKSGYAWDGVSGPVIDTKNNHRASLVHDALYYLMRHQKLDADQYKDEADKLFREICKEDKVLSFIAQIYYLVLKNSGKTALKPGSERKIHRAP